jgi:hypothetical protein
MRKIINFMLQGRSGFEYRLQSIFLYLLAELLQMRVMGIKIDGIIEAIGVI